MRIMAAEIDSGLPYIIKSTMSQAAMEAGTVMIKIVDMARTTVLSENSLKIFMRHLR